MWMAMYLLFVKYTNDTLFDIFLERKEGVQMHKKWTKMQKRVSAMHTKIARRYPEAYILICVHTGRFSLGLKNDGQGGHKHASQVFDCKYGTLQESGEMFRDFLGIAL